MSGCNVTASEVTPGLVVHLDADDLRKRGDCLSNVDAGRGASPVKGPHYFLVLSEADKDGQHLAVPLHSEYKPGRLGLQDEAKAGPAKDWIGPDNASFYSRYQHWKIPTDAIVATSGDDDGREGARRRYGDDKPSIRDVAIECQKDNRNKTFDPVLAT